MKIESEDFRDALRHFPSGVTIVTVKTPEAEKPHGLTVAAFASVSPNPAKILIVVDHNKFGHSLLEQSGAVFAVNILPHDKAELSNRFAWVKDEDRFAVGDWGTAVTGAPVLNDALAWIDCTIYARYEAGSNSIYIGAVQAVKVPRPDEAPLIYWNRGYRYLGLHEPKDEEG